MEDSEVCTEEYIYAPFCSGPSDQGKPGEYAPGETPVHIAEPTCGDPDNFTDECMEYREREYGDPYWGTSEGQWQGGCEEDGTCDDSFTDVCTKDGLVFDYEHGVCMTEEPVVLVSETASPVEPVDTLPHTGMGSGLVLPIALILIAVGIVLIAAAGR